MISASYDFGTDYTLKMDFVHDAVSGATPVWQPDSGSGASAHGSSSDYVYGLEEFDEGRNAGSLLFTSRFANRDELNVGFDYSRESDFDSKALSLEYLHYLDSSHNQSVSLGAAYAYNEILSYEFDGGSGASVKEDSNFISLQAGFTQVINTTSSFKVKAFANLDDGYLDNPYGTVVRDYGTVDSRLVSESRPDSRKGYGVGLEYITQFYDNFSYKGSYRFYTDDWEIDSHTINNRIYYAFSNDLTFELGLRYYTQSEASFYNASKDYFTDEEYASSDERLSDFDAFTYKIGADYKINESFSYNIGAQFYTQSTPSELDATIFTTGIKYRF